MPPSWNDLVNVYALAFDTELSPAEADKVRWGVGDSLGTWSYGLLDSAAILRKEHKDLKTAWRKNVGANYFLLSPLRFMSRVETMWKDPTFSVLPDQEKMNKLRAMPEYKDTVKVLNARGFYVHYLSYEEAKAQAPCPR